MATRRLNSLSERPRWASAALLLASVWAGACLLSVSPVLAQPGPQLPEKTLVDPLDGHTFTVALPASMNSLGGTDSDGCSYASGPQVRTYAVATSPTSLYSARIEEWGEGVTPKSKEALLKLLIPLGADIERASSLHPAERYELAAAISEQIGRDGFTIGDLFLHGAWTIRDTIVGFLPAVQGSSDAWQKLGELVKMSRSVTHPRGRTIALFDMARLSHRGGLIHERDALLAQLDNFEDAGLGAVAKRAQFGVRVEAENRLLRKARERYLQGVEARSRGAEDRALYRFLAAELARRVGDFETAEAELGALALDNSIPKDVKGLVADVRSVLKVQARSVTEAVSTTEGGTK